MNERSVRYLIQQFLKNQCTPEEMEELAHLLKHSENDAEFYESLGEIWEEYQPGWKLPVFKAEAILSEILNKKNEASPLRSLAVVAPLWLKRVSVAAVLMVLIASASIFIYSNHQKKEKEKVATLKHSIKNISDPDNNKAVLTLGDGSRIILDTAHTGLLAHQGNTDVINSKGELIYNRLKKQSLSTSALLYNTLITNKGKLYPLQLPDGTKVWLNAASSIRFPVAFDGLERVVEINGEAYFEVAKDPRMPFRVKLNGMKIEVLGTHFNVNAYADESVVKTTLMEGSVKLITVKKTILLSPGQQAGLQVNGNIDLIKKVDVEEAISWKNGYFHFNNTELKAVLRQLARWYDVEVVYENQEPVVTFSGDIEKSFNISQVMKVLERSQVHCKIDGKKLIVLH